MPRHNHTQPHIRYDPVHLSHTQPKRAFSSKQAAELAIQDIQKYQPDIKLYVYRSPIEGTWHLSSKRDNTNR